jgi:hypothetical protein
VVTQITRVPMELQAKEWRRPKTVLSTVSHFVQLLPSCGAMTLATGKRGGGKGSKSTEYNTAILSCSLKCTQSCRDTGFERAARLLCGRDAGAGWVGGE